MDARIHIIVTGVVQGVGFRWFVNRTAENLGVTGWVKNRRDGSVEIEAEGGRNILEALIKEVKIGPRFSTVRGVNIEWKPFEGDFNNFRVTF
ncbi:acylphosphatase [candidate division KSB1 bacterium]